MATEGRTGSGRLSKDERRKKQQQNLTELVSAPEVAWDQVRLFMDMDAKGFDPNFKDRDSEITTLHRAAYDGRLRMMYWCLQMGADVNFQCLVGRSALHFACDNNQVECVRYLVNEQADVNAVTLSLFTPLHFACQSSHIDTVHILLEEELHVVDVNAADSKGRTPDMLTENSEIVEAIRNYRDHLHEKRKYDAVDRKLLRVFKLFDVDGSGTISQVEWAESLALLARHFDCHSEDNIEEAFEEADADKDGTISWDEFRQGHVNLLAATGIPSKKLMSSLRSLERLFGEETQERISKTRSISRSGTRKTLG